MDPDGRKTKNDCTRKGQQQVSLFKTVVSSQLRASKGKSLQRKSSKENPTVKTATKQRVVQK
jgi:hypothetical protein